jgi:hypothetical protein
MNILFLTVSFCLHAATPFCHRYMIFRTIHQGERRRDGMYYFAGHPGSFSIEIKCFQSAHILALYEEPISRKDILKSVERGEWCRIPDFDKKTKRYGEYARATLRKDNRVNILMG